MAPVYAFASALARLQGRDENRRAFVGATQRVSRFPALPGELGDNNEALSERTMKSTNAPLPSGLISAVKFVAAANLAYFGVEFAVALAIGSVSLFADIVDFLEDTAINVLILMAMSWSPRGRARVGMALGVIILVPSLAALWTAYQKFNTPLPPAPFPLTITGLGAFVVNLTCAMRLASHRHGSGSLTKAAFLSARNDVFANVAIIAAGLITLGWRSPWPDLGVGLAIGLLNAGAAWEIWQEARKETRLDHLEP